MKHLLVLTLLFFAWGFSQTVTPSALAELQPKAPAEIKQYFLDLGWRLMDEHTSEKPQRGDIVMMSSQKADAATLHLTVFHELGTAAKNRLFIKTRNKEFFEAFKTGIEPAGFGFISTKTAGNKKTVTYRSQTTTMELVSYRNGNVFSDFEVWVFDNSYERDLYHFGSGK
ncbi:hypothetical protein FLLO111716_13740 [Flavobacterium longum]|uniref:hypothetical protein n=1 Tax=Flavobacterium longum TaxID=1299340 RepID=UPI0039EC99F4